MCFGLFIAYIDLRTQTRGRRLLDYLAIIPLGLPGIVLGLGLIQGWIRVPLPIYGTIWILLIAYLARGLPLAVRSANTSLLQIDPSLEEAGRIAGDTVYDNVAFGLRLRKLPKEEIRDKVRRMLDLVELSPMAERYPHQLSGGQQQRVALGRSLVSEPSILLLDEPLSNLDVKLREQPRAQLKHLQRRTGITFVYVTHDQAEALALSDRIAVLHEGALQQYGPPREVYERPANLFVADFMGLVNKVEGRLAGSSNGTAQVTIGDKHTLVASLRRGPEQEDRDVMVVIRPEAIQLSANPPALPANVLYGTIAESIFLGNFVEYRIDLKELSLRVQSDRYTIFDVGSQVWLTVPVDECTVM